MKIAFSKEFSRCLIEYYGRMPSASVVSRDFNLRAKDVSAISQETARRWMRSLSLPEMEKLQILIEWLGMNTSFLMAKPADQGIPKQTAGNASEPIRRGVDRRHSGVVLDPLEAYLLKCFKETDSRGKHCLINLAKSLHERPNLTL